MLKSDNVGKFINLNYFKMKKVFLAITLAIAMLLGVQFSFAQERLTTSLNSNAHLGLGTHKMFKLTNAKKAFEREAGGLSAQIAIEIAPLQGGDDWTTEDKGFGFNFGTGIGLGLRGQYNVTEKFAVVGSVGFLLWSKSHDLGSGYSYDRRLNIIPVQIGAKYYLIGGLYGMVEAGIHHITYSEELSHTLGGSAETTKESAMKISYAPNIGFEFNIKSIGFDVSARYQFVGGGDIGAYKDVDAMQYLGIRLAGTYSF
jgi:hypothetical protein